MSEKIFYNAKVGVPGWGGERIRSQEEGRNLKRKERSRRGRGGGLSKGEKKKPRKLEETTESEFFRSPISRRVT